MVFGSAVEIVSLNDLVTRAQVIGEQLFFEGRDFCVLFLPTTKKRLKRDCFVFVRLSRVINANKRRLHRPTGSVRGDLEGAAAERVQTLHALERIRLLDCIVSSCPKAHTPKFTIRFDSFARCLAQIITAVHGVPGHVRLTSGNSCNIRFVSFVSLK